MTRFDYLKYKAFYESYIKSKPNRLYSVDNYKYCFRDGLEASNEFFSIFPEGEHLKEPASIKNAAPFSFFDQHRAFRLMLICK